MASKTFHANKIHHPKRSESNQINLVHLLHGEHPALSLGPVDHLAGVPILIAGTLLLALLAPPLLLAAHLGRRLREVRLFMLMRPCPCPANTHAQRKQNRKWVGFGVIDLCRRFSRGTPKPPPINTSNRKMQSICTHACVTTKKRQMLLSRQNILSSASIAFWRFVGGTSRVHRSSHCAISLEFLCFSTLRHHTTV